MVIIIFNYVKFSMGTEITGTKTCDVSPIT